MTECTILEALPVEILNLILHAIPDVTTLTALIAASPQLLRLYLLQKEQIRTSVVCNQLGRCLPHALLTIRPTSLRSLSSSGLNAIRQPSFDEAMLLYKQDRLATSLIQQCVNKQFKADVQLSAVEMFRMRRGIYNYSVVKLCGERDTEFCTNMCRNLSPKETLETLYIVHCLRDLVKDHIIRLEDLLVKEIQTGNLQTAWMPHELEFIFFGLDIGPYVQKIWLLDAPWMLDFQEFNNMMLPVTVSDMDKFEPDYDNDIDPRRWDEELRTSIPSDYRFNESSFTGIDRSVQPGARYRARLDFEVLFGRLIEAIPLGYMIWDKDRLSRMWWKDSLPDNVSQHDIKVSWKERRSSVESRVSTRNSRQAHQRLNL